MTQGAVGSLAAISHHVSPSHAIPAFVDFFLREKLTPFVGVVELCKIEAHFSFVAPF